MTEQQSKQSRKKTTKKTKKRHSYSKWFWGLFFATVAAIICGIIGYLLIILNGDQILSENANKMVMGEASIIYDADNKEIARLKQAEENRELADFEEIPKKLQEAFVATEDQRFYEHQGIDFFSIGRAVVKDIIARSAVEGGSTITQQLAKNMFLTADKTFFRKATEASIAVALEQNKSKDEILTMYLNRIFFGKSGYGVKGAAKYYFDKELKDLEIWEMATLAGIPKAPSRYNPVSDPEASKGRRAVVLQLMYDQKYITLEEMEKAKAVDYVKPQGRDTGKGDQYTAFVDFAIEEAIRITNRSEEELRIGGFRIYTTLNTHAQQAMQKQFSDEDNFEKSVGEEQVQAAMIIIDHRDGTIQALQGGRDYVNKGLNRVNVPRQPGSSFKPIVSYGPALETGDFYPWTTLKNDQRCFGDYCPSDAKGAAPVKMRQAIKESRNLAAVWLLNEVGIESGMEFAQNLGFQLESDDRNLSIALGGLTKGATPLQMATAYSVFANGGKSVDPHSILKIEDSSGKPVFTYKAPKSKQLMNPETAWYLTEIMQSVLEKGGTGTAARIDRPVAGKTGTTQHGIPGYRGKGNKDVWFVGYSPEWTASVWMGYDKTNKTHVLKRSSSQAARLFGRVMEEALEGEPRSSFKKPSGVKENTPPPVVGNLNAVFVPEHSKVTLTWTGSREAGIQYDVYRKEGSDSDFIKFDENNTSLTVDDMSTFPGMTYEYYVVARDTTLNLESGQSNHVTVQIPETDIEIPEIPLEPEVPIEEPIEPGEGEAGIPGEEPIPPVEDGKVIPDPTNDDELPDDGGNSDPSVPDEGEPTNAPIEDEGNGTNSTDDESANRSNNNSD